MPSVEAVIRNNPSYPINNAGAHQQIVTDLFYSFCNLAQNNWKYGASAAGVNTDMILASANRSPPHGCPVTRGMSFSFVKSDSPKLATQRTLRSSRRTRRT